MIPYIHIPTLKIFGLIPIQPFGVLVGLALVVGYMLGRRRARLTGLDPNIVADGMVWTVVGGFIVAHLVSVLFYFPHRILEEPWILLAVWAGLSSFGGFVGGALGAYLYFKRMGVSIIKYVDAITFGLMPGWILGRMGCSVVHDHPGKPTDFFLGVKFPSNMGEYSWSNFFAGVDSYQGVVRHDLGFYEMLFAIFLTLVLYALKRVRPFDGFHPAVMLILYSPVRFYLDFLRTADKTYFGLTPGQYFAIGLFGLGFYLIARGIRQRQHQSARQATT